MLREKIGGATLERNHHNRQFRAFDLDFTGERQQRPVPYPGFAGGKQSRDFLVKKHDPAAASAIS